MTEVMFVLTVIFVAYVVCVVVDTKKIIVKSTTPTVEPEKPTALPESVPEKKPKTTQAEPAKIVKATVSEKTSTAKKGLKNPKTGEIATTYTNYRFTKRWIKDALVTEGLLEKVYKNDELNADTEAAIKAAIAKLEAMDQYKA